ncbi:MAG: c-type cytochrome [Candidatus Kapabacteria bacterium]|nr:c-type cytochrome [Candidatus Kapabacteria bacterium]
MEFIDKLILPQSAITIVLLKNLLFLGQVVFYIFTGTLFASTFLSIKFGSKSNKLKSDFYYWLSADYINLISSNILMPIGLGLIPLFSIILIYMELLHGTGSKLPIFLWISFVLYTIAILIISKYRSMINSKPVSQMGTENTARDRAKIYGIIGTALLFAFFWLFSAILSSSDEKFVWTSNISVPAMLFSFDTFLHFIIIMISSFGLAGIGFIVKYFFWDKPANINERYLKFVGNLNSNFTLLLFIIVPFLFLLNFVLIPIETLSKSSFLIFAALVAVDIIVVGLVYFNQKSYKYDLSTWAFYGIIVIISLNLYSGALSFDIASSAHTYVLATNYAKFEESTTPVKEVNIADLGKEIYSSKCMACHRFDQKLVGPPHKIVMQKYADKRAEMVSFILKPVKVDPAYPDMPSQGLTPKEARAVVEYMFKEYGEKLK